MKKLIILISCCLFLQIGFSQVKFGFRGGISTADIKTDQLRIKNANDLDALGLSVKESNYGFHLGLFTQAKIGAFFIQPEVLFNSNSVDYAVSDLSDADVIDIIKTESYQYLDIPLMMGLKLGPLRLQAGPVGHVFLNSRSELFDLDGYEQKFDDMTWGWQAGVGLDLWKVILDFKYEGNFSNQGDHFRFFKQDYQFDKSPGRFVASMGIAF